MGFERLPLKAVTRFSVAQAHVLGGKMEPEKWLQGLVRLHSPCCLRLVVWRLEIASTRWGYLSNQPCEREK